MASVGSGNDSTAVPNFHSSAFKQNCFSKQFVSIDKTPSLLSTCEQRIIHQHVKWIKGDDWCNICNWH